MASKKFPRLQSKDGKFARQPSSAAAYHQLVFDGWKPVKEDESAEQQSTDKSADKSTPSSGPSPTAGSAGSSPTK